MSLILDSEKTTVHRVFKNILVIEIQNNKRDNVLNIILACTICEDTS